MKKEKIGMTPISWFFSIVGIILFASLIIVPPVLRILIKEEEKKPEEPEKIVIVSTQCIKKTATETATINITYANDSLMKYSKNTIQEFKSTAEYEQEKQKQGRLTTAYSLLDGVTYDVSVQDSNLKITINEDYNLSTFKAESVTLPDSEEVVEIKDVYKKGDSATGIISELTNDGYECEKVSQ